MFCSKIERSNFKAKHGEWKCYVSPWNKRLIELSSEGNKFLLGKMDTWADASRQYPIEAVASVLLLRDDVIITSTNRGSQLAGAAVGGLMAGPVGVMGGLSGSTRGISNIKKIAIKVIVDDHDLPVHVIEFFTSSRRVADELTKLWALRQSGALTDDEYTAQKSRIISG